MRSYLPFIPCNHTGNFFLLGALLIAGCQSDSAPPSTVLTGQTMGTSWKVVLPDVADAETAKHISRLIIARLELINKAMSTYRDDSEVSRFNSSSSVDWFAVSNATAVVITEAQRISALSDGAFDITVAPLVNLWNFGPELHDTLQVPAAGIIVEQAKHVGYQKLKVRLSPPAIQKSDPLLQIDLSAIAKGFAVDEVTRLLEEEQLTNYLVEIGGEVRTGGFKRGQTAWKLGIEAPVEQRQTVRRVVELRSTALATSGDYRNFRMIAGKRYSHTIDPRTFHPVTHQLASASVIVDSCMTADALATTLMVLGPEAGFQFAERNKIPTLFMTREDAGFSESITLSFQPFLSRPEQAATNSHSSDLLPMAIGALVVFLLAVTGMAIGVIVKNRCLQGSCGGLSAMQDDSGNSLCESCTTPAQECPRKLEESS